MRLLSPDWTLAIKNLLFPIFCRQCGVRLLTEENGYFCPTCWEASPRIERPFCPVCGRPHRPGAGLGTRANFRCGPCSTAPHPPPYRRILAAAKYRDAVELAVKLFKFHDKPRLAGPLGDLLREQAQRELDCDEYDIVLPVPLHRVRKRMRGYNQSELLAREALPAFPNARLEQCLLRTRPTAALSRMHSGPKRRAGVRGAFEVSPGGAVNGARVLLIDDVVTTGATVSECAAVLRKAGATTVDVLSAALALPRAADDAE